MWPCAGPRRGSWSSGRAGRRVARCRAARVVMLIGSGAGAQSPAQDPVIARVTITAPADLLRFMPLALDMLEMRDGNDLFVLTTSTEVDRLRADGWTIRIDQEQTSMLERQRQEQRRRRAPVPRARAAAATAAAPAPPAIAAAAGAVRGRLPDRRRDPRHAGRPRQPVPQPRRG